MGKMNGVGISVGRYARKSEKTEDQVRMEFRSISMRSASRSTWSVWQVACICWGSRGRTGPAVPESLGGYPFLQRWAPKVWPHSRSPLTHQWVLSFCLICGVTLSYKKLRRAVQHWIGSTRPEHHLPMKIYEYGWIPRDITIKVDGATEFLGGLHDLRHTGIPQAEGDVENSVPAGGAVCVALSSATVAGKGLYSGLRVYHRLFGCGGRDRECTY